MDVFESVRHYYEEAIDWKPDIKRTWVEKYLRHLEAQGKSHEKLIAIWDDIYSFSHYMDRSEHKDPSALPYWEYSVCLQWMEGHIIDSANELTLKNARRFLGNLLDFYKFLSEKGHIKGYAELEKAYAEICGGKKLKLVKRIPYTGNEQWTSISFKGKMESFIMSDYWLIVLFMSSKRSWEHLKQLARDVKSSIKKTQQIWDLERKLKNIGYSSQPEKLLIPYGAPSNDDMDYASKWFFGR